MALKDSYDYVGPFIKSFPLKTFEVSLMQFPINVLNVSMLLLLLLMVSNVVVNKSRNRLSKVYYDNGKPCWQSLLCFRSFNFWKTYFLNGSKTRYLDIVVECLVNILIPFQRQSWDKGERICDTMTTERTRGFGTRERKGAKMLKKSWIEIEMG